MKRKTAAPAKAQPPSAELRAEWRGEGYPATPTGAHYHLIDTLESWLVTGQGIVADVARCLGEIAERDSLSSLFGAPQEDRRMLARTRSLAIAVLADINRLIVMDGPAAEFLRDLMHTAPPWTAEDQARMEAADRAATAALAAEKGGAV